MCRTEHAFVQRLYPCFRAAEFAAYDARRPTADVDALARGLVNDQDTVVARITDVADQAADDGVEFLTDTAVAGRSGRTRSTWGVRVAMDRRIATAIVRFRVEVNFGDPVTPAPRMVELPSYDPDTARVRAGRSDRDRAGGEARDRAHARRGEHTRPGLRRHLHADRDATT